MLLKITEYNAWERERWSHVIDLDKQDADSLNYLFSFIRLANEHYEEVKAESHAQGQDLWAASRYSTDFWDHYQPRPRPDGHPVLKTKERTLVLNGGKGYRDNVIDFNAVISRRKMLSARNRMRDKKENTLYKNLETMFLKNP